MKLDNVTRRLRSLTRSFPETDSLVEPQQLLLGRMLSMQVRSRAQIGSLADVEFKVFSQWGDDGIIQWLTSRLQFPHRTFIEFGVENYRESNTRFLMINDNWSGLVMDGSPEHVAHIRSQPYYWQHEVQATCAFIDAENINSLISDAGLDPEVGILHVDLDGNDYWIWKSIHVVRPVLLILEYNAVFGCDRAITVPYDPLFQRTAAHHSNLYFGASLAALHQLSQDKGYAFIGCNSAGNNAYFVRRDKLVEGVREVGLEEGYVPSRFREARDSQGELTYVSGAARVELIRGLPVVDVRTGQTVTL